MLLLRQNASACWLRLSICMLFCRDLCWLVAANCSLCRQRSCTDIWPYVCWVSGMEMRALSPLMVYAGLATD